MNNLSSIYTELIMEHNKSKHNKHAMTDADISKRGHNPNCGDDLTVHLKLEDGVIKDVSYEGSGCAISEASTSIMIDLLRGESVEVAKQKIADFLDMIKGDIDEDELIDSLEDATILANIKNMPARVKCAVLAWHSLEECIKAME